MQGWACSSSPLSCVRLGALVNGCKDERMHQLHISYRTGHSQGLSSQTSSHLECKDLEGESECEQMSYGGMGLHQPLQVPLCSVHESTEGGRGMEDGTATGGRRGTVGEGTEAPAVPAGFFFWLPLRTPSWSSGGRGDHTHRASAPL